MRPFSATIRAGFVAAVFTAAFAHAAAPAAAVEDPPQGIRPDLILIQPAPGVAMADVGRFHAAQGARVLREFRALGGIQVLSLPPGRNVPASLQRYRESGLFEFAEADHPLRLAATPNDPYYTEGLLWHLHNDGQSGGRADADIDAPEAWDLANNASTVVVAIVDSGIRATHEDLAANLWVNPGEIPGNGVDDDANGFVDDVHGINAAAGTGQPVDLIGHGTTVAGFIGSVANNGVGGTGVAWRTRLMACRFTDDAGHVYLSTAAQAMDYALAQGAHIINASFIDTVYSSTLYSAINRCRAAGVIVVAAAGNSGANTDNTPYYPASFDLDNVVAVAATTRTDQLAAFSNYGATSVDLAAPGQDLWSTHNAGDQAYQVNSGTSLSAPIVTGALALLRARHPTATHRQLIEQLLRSTDPLPSLAGRCVTGGRLNLARALNPAVTPSFTATPMAGIVPMTVRFTNTSLGLAQNVHWSFGDGGSSAEANPIHTYTTPGEFTASLAVTGVDGGIRVTNQLISAVLNYGEANATFAWIDPASMPSLGLTGDAVSPAQPLPFPFQFYGVGYTSLHVGANGLLGFESQSLGRAANMDLPDAAAPNNIICPFWDDLNPSSTGVRFGIVGSAPDRKAVISWVSASGVGGPQANYTFQVVLEETSNDILFQYLEVQPGSRNASAGGKSATIGLEHRSGLLARKYAYNGSRLLTNHQAIRFTAPSAVGSGTNNPPITLIQPAWNGGSFSFSFTSQVSRVYEARFLDHLEASPGATNWQLLGTLTGDGTVLTVTNLAPAGLRRFYRIESR